MNDVNDGRGDESSSRRGFFDARAKTVGNPNDCLTQAQRKGKYCKTMPVE